MRALSAAGVVVALATVGIVTVAGQAEHESTEQELPIEAVPAHVRAAAIAAVEGVVLTEAEVEAVLVYELEGRVGNRTVEIEVTAESDVIGVEDEENEDDDGDHDDDDHDGGDDDDGDD